jgi:hypothetical protein
MRKAVQKAHQAMLEGDRDAVLRHLEGLTDDGETLWLKAHAVESVEERLQLMGKVASSHHPTYGETAQQIMNREEYYQAQLAEPPDYQFWKQPTWRKKLDKLKKQTGWLIGALFIVVFIIVFLIVSRISDRKNERANLAFLASQTSEVYLMQTQTSIAYMSQVKVSYPAGSLEAIGLENPTQRPVTFGNTSNEAYIIAPPAVGSHFVAIKLKYTCLQALCSDLPQAEIILLLNGGGKVSYQSHSRPFLVEQPTLPRLASNASAEIWVVFEVAIGSVPEALMVYAADEYPAQRISLSQFR